MAWRHRAANCEGDGLAWHERQPSCREAFLRDLFKIGLEAEFYEGIEAP